MLKELRRSRYLVPALLAALLGVQSNACERPDKVAIPTGDRVTESDLLETDESVKQYMGAMYVYLDCVAAETAEEQRSATARDIESVRQRENDAITLHNAATAEMKQTLDEFAKTVQEYRDRQGS